MMGSESERVLEIKSTVDFTKDSDSDHCRDSDCELLSLEASDSGGDCYSKHTILSKCTASSSKNSGDSECRILPQGSSNSSENSSSENILSLGNSKTKIFHRNATKFDIDQITGIEKVREDLIALKRIIQRNPRKKNSFNCVMCNAENNSFEPCNSEEFKSDPDLHSNTDSNILLSSGVDESIANISGCVAREKELSEVSERSHMNMSDVTEREKTDTAKSSYVDHENIIQSITKSNEPSDASEISSNNVGQPEIKIEPLEELVPIWNENIVKIEGNDDIDSYCTTVETSTGNVTESSKYIETHEKLVDSMYQMEVNCNSVENGDSSLDNLEAPEPANCEHVDVNEAASVFLQQTHQSGDINTLKSGNTFDEKIREGLVEGYELKNNSISSAGSVHPVENNYIRNQQVDIVKSDNKNNRNLSTSVSAKCEKLATHQKAGDCMHHTEMQCTVSSTELTALTPRSMSHEDIAVGFVENSSVVDGSVKSAMCVQSVEMNRELVSGQLLKYECGDVSSGNNKIQDNYTDRDLTLPKIKCVPTASLQYKKKPVTTKEARESDNIYHAENMVAISGVTDTSEKSDHLIQGTECIKFSNTHEENSPFSLVESLKNRNETEISSDCVYCIEEKVTVGSDTSNTVNCDSIDCENTVIQTVDGLESKGTSKNSSKCKQHQENSITVCGHTSEKFEDAVNSTDNEIEPNQYFKEDTSTTKEPPLILLISQSKRNMTTLDMGSFKETDDDIKQLLQTSCEIEISDVSNENSSHTGSYAQEKDVVVKVSPHVNKKPSECSTTHMEILLSKYTNSDVNYKELHVENAERRTIYTELEKDETPPSKLKIKEKGGHYVSTVMCIPLQDEDSSTGKCAQNGQEKIRRHRKGCVCILCKEPKDKYLTTHLDRELMDVIPEELPSPPQNKKQTPNKTLRSYIETMKSKRINAQKKRTR